ncbi:MAG: hypothetical protein RR496_03845 [Lachnospiraceae bacterium]
MKVTKGDAGYLTARKKKQILIALVEFAIVGLLLAAGWIKTGSRMNIMTVIAVLGCLPACDALLSVIMIFPHPSIPCEKAEEIAKKTPLLTVAYDMVITSRETSAMPVDCIVISDNTICGYVHSSKVGAEATALYIKKMLVKNHYGKASVKLFPDYHAFLTRAETMNQNAQIEQPDGKEKEETMKALILSISL